MAYSEEKYKRIDMTCRGCEKRHPGCHDHCPDYQEAHAEWTKFKEMTRKNKKLHTEFEGFMAEKKRRLHGK